MASLSRRKLLSGTALALAGWAGWNGYRLSAAPLHDKDCGPISSIAATGADAAGPLPWSSKGGTVNDVSCLSRTPVFGVVKVASEKDVADALAYARENNLKVSTAGARHSMGGHAFANGGIVLDMTDFKGVTINAELQSITVQSGARWHDIQNLLHPHFAIKAMQSSDVFTVGGSISVNAHGMDHHVGAIERTIKWLRVMLADGTTVKLSRTENPDLYRHVVGGYGLFGVILDVELEIAANTVYSSKRELIHLSDFPKLWSEKLEPDDSIGLFYGHLSTSPDSFLDELLVYTYHVTDVSSAGAPPLGDVSSVAMRRLIFNLAKEGNLLQRLKWYSEKELEHRFESCTLNDIVKQSGESCLVSRNEPMHDSVPYLFNALDYETDILHEYFVPRKNLVPFVSAMRTLMLEQDTLLLNASIRVVHREDIALNYAPEEAFSVVLYVNQRVDDAGIAKMARLTSSLIDLADQHGGRFFLPYQRHYNAQQLKRAYPMIAEVFQAKSKYDPAGLFSNSFYAAYASEIGA
jgi:FAD/FMN-containing dehydrogenase